MTKNGSQTQTKEVLSRMAEMEQMLQRVERLSAASHDQAKTQAEARISKMEQEMQLLAREWHDRMSAAESQTTVAMPRSDPTYEGNKSKSDGLSSDIPDYLRLNDSNQ